MFVLPVKPPHPPTHWERGYIFHILNTRDELEGFKNFQGSERSSSADVRHISGGCLCVSNGAYNLLFFFFCGESHLLLTCLVYRFLSSVSDFPIMWTCGFTQNSISSAALHLDTFSAPVGVENWSLCHFTDGFLPVWLLNWYNRHKLWLFDFFIFIFLESDTQLKQGNSF